MKFDRAIVIGGSITGLLSAKVLAQRFREVIIIDKDQLNNDNSARRYLSQSEHPHVLLAKGYRLLENMLPGIGSDLAKAGAIEIDWATDYHIYYAGCGWNARSNRPSDIKSYSCSRKLLERCIRNRIVNIANIRFLEYRNVSGLEAGDSHKTVIGVRLRDSNGLDSSLNADIVVDASGRISSTSKWLAYQGWESPIEVKVNPYLGYSTCRFKIPEGKNIPWKVLTYPHVAPEYNRKAYLAKIENNELIAAMGGYSRDYPPVNLEDYFEFARNFQDKEFYEVIYNCKPITKVYPYRGTANYLRQFDKIEMPSGLVVIGDAYCSLSPSYGQGMTCSAIGVSVFQDWLKHQSDISQPSNTSAFQISLAKQIVPQWNIAVQQDLGFSETSTTDSSLIISARKRSTFPLFYIDSYFEKLIAATTVDYRLNYLFIEVINIVKSPLFFFSFRTIFLVSLSILKNNKTKSGEV